MKRFGYVLPIALAFLVAPVVAKASTIEELSSIIESLRSEIKDLRAQVYTSTFITPATTLKNGSTGPEVVALQTFLANKGFYTSVIDGVYGFATSSALGAYKQTIGFTSYGSAFAGNWVIAGDTTTSATTALVSGTTSPCVVDFNGDGVIRVADFELIVNNLSQTPTNEQRMYDVSRNGIVDARDVKEMLKHYGRTNNCLASSISSAEWLASVNKPIVAAPAPSAVPAGSDWNVTKVGGTPAEAWLWDYHVLPGPTYTRKQIRQTVGGVEQPPVWTTKIDTPIIDANALNYTNDAVFNRKKIVGPNTRLENINGSLHGSAFYEYTTTSGLQVQNIVKTKLVTPAVDRISAFDVLFEKVGNTIVNKSYINKKPISSYAGHIYPKLWVTSQATASQFIVRMRILNDGPTSDTTSLMGVGDNVPEVDYIFTSQTDPRLQTINIASGTAPAYNATTNTITLDMSKGAVVWMTYMQRPGPTYMSAIPASGFITGYNWEPKGWGRDWAFNFTRNKTVILNSDFVPVQQQGL